MSTEQEPRWGEPTPTQPRPRWSGRKTLAAVAIAVVISAGGGAAIWAATANEAGTSQHPGGPYGGPGGPGGPGPGGRFGIGALDSALHGEFVIADGTTQLLQTGKVTQVSDTSIDVTSSDGYAHSYTINSSTRKVTDIKTGDEVTVIARKNDNAALTIVNRSNLPKDGRGRPDRPQPSTPPTT